MATFTVTTAADVVNASDGVLSLREAVLQANTTAATDTIVFAAAIEGKTLALGAGELSLAEDTVIDGDQNNDGVRVTLSGGENSRIFYTDLGLNADLTLTDLDIKDGYGTRGGAIYFRRGDLKINNSTLTSIFAGFEYNCNICGESGGAISFEGGNLDISNSRISGNFSDDGSGIKADARVVMVSDRDISGNRAGSYGGNFVCGGGLSVAGTLIVERSTISNNFANGGGGISFSGRADLG